MRAASLPAQGGCVGNLSIGSPGMAQVEPAAASALPPMAGQELPIEGKTVKALTLLSLKRTYDLFVGNHSQKVGLDEDSQKLKIACKVQR